MDFKAGLYDSSGAGITGSTDLKIKIKRDADDYFYDFNDSTFKNAGWTTIAATMTQIDATNVPGEYEYTVDVSAWDDGVYTVYFQYSGSVITPFTDAVEFRVYDGKESGPLADEILADTDELQTNQGNWVTAVGFATPTNVSDAQAAIIAEVDANETKIDAVDTKAVAVQAKTDNLPDDPADASVIAGRFDTVDSGVSTVGGKIDTTNARLTADRAGYLEKLNVAGTLANTDNANTFKADVSALQTAAQALADKTAILNAISTHDSDIKTVLDGISTLTLDDIFTQVIDGTITFAESVKIILAIAGAKGAVDSGSSVAFKAQDGTTIVTFTYNAAETAMTAEVS